VLIGTGHSATAQGATARLASGGVEWITLPFPLYSLSELSRIVTHNGLWIGAALLLSFSAVISHYSLLSAVCCLLCDVM